MYKVSESGWINQDIYLKRFDFIHQKYLLLGQFSLSKMAMDLTLLKKARANDIHMLCLPAHTTHLLQPLDVGVFKSFKAHFNKACQKHMQNNPGQVITPTILAPTVAEALTNSLTPLNILRSVGPTL